jgi:DNA polymerase III sliding clamp (beta) subunit (PCNA family)
MTAGSLRAMLLQVAPFVSRDETRVHMTGAAVEVRDGRTLLIASDGRRLALAERSGELAIDAPHGLGLLPADTLTALCVGLATVHAATEVRLAAPTAEGPVAVYASTAVLASGPGIEAKFPDWRAVMPPAVARFCAAVDKKSLTAALKAVLAQKKAVLASQLAGEIGACKTGAERRELRQLRQRFAAQREMLRLSLAPNGVRVDAEGCDTVSVPCDLACPGAARLTIGANGRYLLDALAVMPGRTVHAHFTDEYSPILFADAAEKADRSITVITMPCRLNAFAWRTRVRRSADETT